MKKLIVLFMVLPLFAHAQFEQYFNNTWSDTSKFSADSSYIYSFQVDGSQPFSIPEDGQVYGTEGMNFLDYFVAVFLFTQPSINLTLNGGNSVLLEVGDSLNLTVSTSVTVGSETSFSNGHVDKTNAPTENDFIDFGSNTSGSKDTLFVPKQGYSDSRVFSFRAYTTGANSGPSTISSSTRTANSVYPIFYGLTNLDLTSASGTDVYDELTKLVAVEGDRTVVSTGEGYFCYAVPKEWSDYTIDIIRDGSGYDVTPAFTQYDVTVSSDGLSTDYSEEEYVIYIISAPLINATYTYTFNF